MRILNGTVVGGKVVVEGATPAEGRSVLVIVGEPGAPVRNELTAEEQSALLAALARIEAEEPASWEDLARQNGVEFTRRC